MASAAKSPSMVLYTPCTPPGAVPPRNYPPTWCIQRDLATAAALACLWLAGQGWALARSGWEAGSFAGIVDIYGIGNVAQALSVATVVYAVISGLVLRRKHWWASRYSHTNPAQLAAALCLVAALEVCTSRGWAHFLSADLLVGVFLGLHIVYADGSAWLASFGVKWSNPSHWVHFTPLELIFAVSLGLGLAGSVAAVSGGILMSGAWARLTWLYGGVGLLAGTVALLTRGTHTWHMHHYALAATMLPVACLDTSVSRFWHGVFLGLLVEGCAVWGVDPLRIRVDDGSPAAADACDMPTSLWLELALNASSQPAWDSAVRGLLLVAAAVQRSVSSLHSVPMSPAATQIALNAASDMPCVRHALDSCCVQLRGVAQLDAMKLLQLARRHCPEFSCTSQPPCPPEADALAQHAVQSVRDKPHLLSVYLDTLYLGLVCAAPELLPVLGDQPATDSPPTPSQALLDFSTQTKDGCSAQELQQVLRCAAWGGRHAADGEVSLAQVAAERRAVFRAVRQIIVQARDFT